MSRRTRPARARLLVLGAGPAQLGLLEAARLRPDVRVVVADRDPAAPGFALADERAIVSTEDEQALERLARAREVHGIVSPGSDWPVGIAARIAERLGLPHPIDGATASLATSKVRQRERFREAGVPHARSLDPDGDVVDFPCVVKAPDRQGQRGLTLVRDRAGLDRALELARSESRSGGVLVEELVDGPEVTVIGLLDDGVFHALAATDRIVAEPPAFGVALAHVWPSLHAGADTLDAAARACAALGIRHGPVYVQARVAADGPRVMEAAARLGGGHDAELVHAATGVDLNQIAIAAALGEPLQPLLTGTQPSVAGGCVRFLQPPEGTLRAVLGVDEAAAVDGVAWVRIYRSPGWAFGPFLRGADRAGAILATGPDRAAAVARADRATEAVRFQVDAATA